MSMTYILAESSFIGSDLKQPIQIHNYDNEGASGSMLWESAVDVIVELIEMYFMLNGLDYEQVFSILENEQEVYETEKIKFSFSYLKNDYDKGKNALHRFSINGYFEPIDSARELGCDLNKDNVYKMYTYEII